MSIVTDAEAAKIRDYPATIAEERLLDTREALLKALESIVLEPVVSGQDVTRRFDTARSLINQARGLPDSETT